MFTGRDELVAELFRRKRLDEAEVHRLCRALSRSRRRRFPEKCALLPGRAVHVAEMAGYDYEMQDDNFAGNSFSRADHGDGV